MKLNLLTVFISLSFFSHHLMGQQESSETSSDTIVYITNCVSEINKYQCTQDKIKAIFLENLKYPNIALENSIEGSLAIRITIDSEGKIKNQEILHHFKQNSDKSLKKLFKKNVLKDIQFHRSNSVHSKNDVKLEYIFHLTIPTLKTHHLSNFEQILCERSDLLLEQSIRKKSLQRYLKQSKEIQEYWYYKLDFAKFISFDLNIQRDGKIIENVKNIKNIHSKRLAELILDIKKNDILQFTIFEEKNENIVLSHKIIIIK